jgi:hypothetical protein
MHVIVYIYTYIYMNTHTHTHTHTYAHTHTHTHTHYTKMQSHVHLCQHKHAEDTFVTVCGHTHQGIAILKHKKKKYAGGPPTVLSLRILVCEPFVLYKKTKYIQEGGSCVIFFFRCAFGYAEHICSSTE